MKRIINIVLLIVISINFATAQNWKNYFQFGVGTGYLMDAQIKDTPFLTLEYGKVYKWLDLNAALEYAPLYSKNTSIRYNHMSLVLRAKFDFVRMFKADLRHSFKLGAGVGVGTANFNNWWYNTSGSNFYTLFSVMASYEFRIVDKTWLGVFFNNYVSDNFFGMHYLGLNVRRDF
jgi:hypothetical protein